MSEYIEREKAIMYAHNALPFNPNECEKLEEVLRMMPSDDVAPVAHGKWLGNGIEGSALSRCSVCGFDCGAYLFNYCPNCGAKMDGSEDK